MDEAAEKIVAPDSLKLYEAQFFGFTPQTCMLRIYSAFHDSLYELMLVVESVFKRKLSPAGQEPPEELCVKMQQCSQKLLQFLQERFELLSSRMETLLVDNILSVPPNVLLPEDESHRKYPQGSEELMRMERSLAELHQAYQAEVCAKQALLAELGEQKEVQEHLGGILSWVGELRTCGRQEGLVQDNFAPLVETVRHLQDVKAKILMKSRDLDEL
ncbi:hypothetical protein AALO_G00105690 [Alosa alosa]|uniref:Protein MIS12 homolog n=1 Tax=Alosa alosa TaxID=278164 RepID=A0AAV6GVB1_9TELE|nr:protein MIS12 homolog [Alosa alosa]KAG5279063.1 hypothetical protein AALO_G00105690 [Alosa alosa]